MDDVWSFLDAFSIMDKLSRGSIRRGDYVWALGAHGDGVEFHRAVRRADLSGYFHFTAKDLSLAEFMRRALPNASASDMEKVEDWMELWKANHIVTRPAFMGRRDEIQQVFSCLDKSCAGVVRLRQLVKARLLRKDELEAVGLLGALPAGGLNFNDFCDLVQPVLVAKFCENPQLAPKAIGLRRPSKLKLDDAIVDETISPQGARVVAATPLSQAESVFATSVSATSMTDSSREKLQSKCSNTPRLPPMVQQSRRRLGALGGG